MIAPFKSTPKRNRMAVILASKYDHPCYFCGNHSTVCVDTVAHPATDYIEIRHKCARHKLFGYWPGYDKAWGRD